MTRVCVTGASGKAGRVTVRELLAHGYEVVATDAVAPADDLGVRVIRADLTDFGEAVEVLHGTDAVVHLANIPAPEIHTSATTFNANVTMNANIFNAATKVGLTKVVWASSETTLGLPFDTPPAYAPVDEAHYPHPTSTYALSKVVSETAAGHFARWSGIPFVALRFSNILSPANYPDFPAFSDDPALRKWNLWGYVDERDAAVSCRLALEADVSGSTSYIIAAADTVMRQSSAQLLKEVYPQTPLTREVDEHETLLSIDLARAVLGFEPRHSWRDHV
ncbi:NAD-dependent epimerase/dehydratase family protein [Fodinicola acaciae]|uniref:NAD-dependent epimerase/dehydratase family protein n=1 Tax=Fodinicola acaciae TaxID=2681555 RepID=UPI0013D2FA03|nr:NAD(P)-dependent oxidoreductase [Fodinicola acaciae]